MKRCSLLLAIAITLTFERAGSIGVEVIIFAPEGTSPGHMKNDKKMEGG